MKTKYRQCTLERRATSSTVYTQISFLPERFAKVGEIVRLKEENGAWSDGWEVLAVGELVNEPPDYRQLIKGHRKETGDSLPKVKPQ